MPTASHPSLIAQACRLIDHSEEAPRLATLAASAGLSPAHFHRLFKAHTGLTPKAYADAARARRAREGLADPARSITEAAFGAGFNAGSRFYASSQPRLGMPPRQFRQGGAGVRIQFALAQCSLGAILVAESAKGICAILLGDEPEALLHSLQDAFPNAELLGADAAFEARVAQVVGFVEAPRLGLALPLDIQGTAFQERVWQALREIPPGETASYTAIAARIGQPQAVRAVAQACAANRLAVAVPCHRVVRHDGALSGYRWGVERKRELLRKEQ